jgi:hypothetical protein
VDSIQERHERAVGDALIGWLNRREGRSLSFMRRGDDAPDLIYREGFDDLGLEIVGAYYDQDDATLLWQNARNVPNAPTEWSGVNFDSALLRSIEMRVREKCRKAYGANCALLVAVQPGLTTAPEMKRTKG